MFATFKINLHKLSGDNWNQYYEMGMNVYKEYKRENKETAGRQPFCVCSPGERAPVFFGGEGRRTSNGIAISRVT